MIDRLARRRLLRDLEDQALAEGRIPPGQSLTLKWPVLSAGPVQHIHRAAWRLRVFGCVDNPFEVSWEEFSSLPGVQRRSDIHCVTHWTKLDNDWEGVPVTTIFDKARVRPEATFAMVHAPDYAANIDLEALEDDGALFAWRHNGADLSAEHGGPVRLVIPQRYFWKSVKWVTGLELMEKDRPGFWEDRGYHMSADPWSEQRYGE